MQIEGKLFLDKPGLHNDVVAGAHVILLLLLDPVQITLYNKAPIMLVNQDMNQSRCLL